MPIYEMVIAKGGPKLQAAQDDVTEPEKAKSRAKGPAGFPALPDGNEGVMLMMSTKDGPAISLRGHNETATEIASTLSHQVDRPIRDGTSLRGTYDFTLYWIARPISPAVADPNEAAASLAEAPGVPVQLEKEKAFSQ